MLGQEDRPPKAFRRSIISVRLMVDLRTEIAGVRLRNPTMLASGFLDETGGAMGRGFQAGARGGGTERNRPKTPQGAPTPTIPGVSPRPPHSCGLPYPPVGVYTH